MVGPSGLDHFVDHFPHLVDLDREDTAIGSAVPILCDGGREDLVDLTYLVFENVVKPHDDGKLCV